MEYPRGTVAPPITPRRSKFYSLVRVVEIRRTGISLLSAQYGACDCLHRSCGCRARLLENVKAEMQQSFKLETDLVSTLRTSCWMGSKNTLSQGHHDWPVIDEVATATQKHARRGVAFDGRTHIKREAFYQILS